MNEMTGACNSTIFFSQPKGKILNFNYKVNFRDFKPNFGCLLTNERYKTHQTVFSFGRLGHAQSLGLGVLGCQ